jgi:hypothetical protein
MVIENPFVCAYAMRDNAKTIAPTRSVTAIERQLATGFGDFIPVPL